MNHSTTYLLKRTHDHEREHARPHLPMHIIYSYSYNRAATGQIASVAGPRPAVVCASAITPTITHAAGQPATLSVLTLLVSDQLYNLPLRKPVSDQLSYTCVRPETGAGHQPVPVQFDAISH